MSIDLHRLKGIGLLVGLLILILIMRPVHAQMIEQCDPTADTKIRRTDSGADGPIDLQNHRLPGLIGYRIGQWSPQEPEEDLFFGTWSGSGDFLRFDLILKGVMNPPGPLGCCGDPAYDPYRYGPNPLYGFVELDVDQNTETGGELEIPEDRYTGNVARMGGLPTGSEFNSRIALSGHDVDPDIETQPLVERSGADFHLTFEGWEIDQCGIIRSDLSDWQFDAGETWRVPGHLFQRAHGYRNYSSACCRAGVVIGSYEPYVQMLFSHDPREDTTTVSLVYPLTNSGSAAARGDESTEEMDVLFTNQNSIEEALFELKISALAASPFDRDEPEFALIAPWEQQNPDHFLQPSLWRVTILLGGTYTQPQPDSFYVWSDLYPNILRGDFNGNGNVNPSDLQRFNQYMIANDGHSDFDADGMINDQVEIISFGDNFSLYDLNYDGMVNDEDRQLIMAAPVGVHADLDGDGDVDQRDFGRLQRCFGQPVQNCNCLAADLDRDQDVDMNDLNLLLDCAGGPDVPATFECR